MVCRERLAILGGPRPKGTRKISLGIKPQSPHPISPPPYDNIGLVCVCFIFLETETSCMLPCVRLVFSFLWPVTYVKFVNTLKITYRTIVTIFLTLQSTGKPGKLQVLRSRASGICTKRKLHCDPHCWNPHFTIIKSNNASKSVDGILSVTLHYLRNIYFLHEYFNSCSVSLY